MINQTIKEAIIVVHEKLHENKITWVLVGSANMQLQGMNVSPRDLDVVIHRKDLENVSNIFSGYGATPMRELKTLTGEPAWEVKAIINGIEVQFFGGDDTDTYVSKLVAGRIILVPLSGIKIPCFTLETESQTYRETHREHKVKMIQEFLRTRQGE